MTTTRTDRQTDTDRQKERERFEIFLSASHAPAWIRVPYGNGRMFDVHTSHVSGRVRASSLSRHVKSQSRESLLFLVISYEVHLGKLNWRKMERTFPPLLPSQQRSQEKVSLTRARRLYFFHFLPSNPPPLLSQHL